MNLETKAKAKTGVHYHVLRQTLFEHSLLMMESVLGHKGSLIDLGAGHCKFSMMANAMNWQATALDARSARKPENLPDSITYILGDVDSDVWRAENYDVILCLGLYYHLSQEMQHRLLRRCSGKPLILDTHFANPPGKEKSRYGPLGETYEKNGEVGADYIEPSQSNDAERKSSQLLASFENTTSWWQTPESLRLTLHQFGWPHIWTFNYLQEEFIQRTFFICYTADLTGTGASGIRF